MKKAAASFLLVMLIEAVSAIARYLKDHLLSKLHRDQGGSESPPEFC